MERWLKQLAEEPREAFEDLVFGGAEVGQYSRASMGEIFLVAYREQKGGLDEGAHGFLEKYLLAPVPELMTSLFWGSQLKEIFRGLTSLELKQTNEFLRTERVRLRLWLSGYYDGPSLDPEADYLRALTWAQNDNSLVPLWRRLALGEEGRGIEWVEIGLLGLRKARSAKNGTKRPPHRLPRHGGIAMFALCAPPTGWRRSSGGQSSWPR
jgi:hypothetical protein